MGQDVFKILKDLEMKIIGLDPKINKMQEGFFCSFRTTLF
jgi:phosphoglycerate dehydrogenase-like enzyme